MSGPFDDNYLSKKKTYGLPDLGESLLPLSQSNPFLAPDVSSSFSKPLLPDISISNNSVLSTDFILPKAPFIEFDPRGSKENQDYITKLNIKNGHIVF